MSRLLWTIVQLGALAVIGVRGRRLWRAPKRGLVRTQHLLHADADSGFFETRPNVHDHSHDRDPDFPRR